MSLNDLLNNTFGKNQSSVPKKEKSEIKKKTTRNKKNYLNLGKDECVELKIALNYAINSIKKKSDVVQEKEDSTYFSYFRSWNKIREKLKEKLEN